MNTTQMTAEQKANLADMIENEISNIDELDLLEEELMAADAEVENDVMEVSPVDEIEIVDEDEFAEVEAELTLQEAKKEAYTEQDAEVTEVVSESDKPSEASTAKKAVKAVRKTVAGSGKKSDVFVDKLGEGASTFFLELSDAELEESELKKAQDAILTTVDTMAVKVAEKAINIVAAANNGAKLSTYTEIALKFLEAKPEGFTAKELIEHYSDQKANGVKGYSQGTANSQAHQMFKLLPALKIAVLDGKLMKLNPNSFLMIALKGTE